MGTRHFFYPDFLVYTKQNDSDNDNGLNSSGYEAIIISSEQWILKASIHNITHTNLVHQDIEFSCSHTETISSIHFRTCDLLAMESVWAEKKWNMHAYYACV